MPRAWATSGRSKRKTRTDLASARLESRPPTPLRASARVSGPGGRSVRATALKAPKELNRRG
ncbi:hypothetical protein D3C80_1748860 [compost metagenome]